MRTDMTDSTPSPSSGFGQRQPWLDAARCLACLCVLLIHVTYDGGSGGHVAIAIYDYYAVCGASIVFFMITGALTLWRPQPLGRFMRKRVHRVFIPMALWSALTLLLYACLGRIEWSALSQHLLLIAIKPQVPQFWFIYVAMGIYLLTPMVATWLQQATRRQVAALLLAWCSTLFIPWLEALLPGSDTLIDRQHGPLFYFQGYAGLSLLGYYIRRWVSPKQWIFWFIGGALLLSFPLLLRFASLPTHLFTTRLSPNVIALSFILVVMIKHVRIPVSLHRLLYVAGQITFGIYLTHMPVIRLVVAPLMQHSGLNYWVGLPLATALTALLTSTIVWLISLTPLARILGCELKLH